jgi:hypothetical protein
MVNKIISIDKNAAFRASHTQPIGVFQGSNPAPTDDVDAMATPGAPPHRRQALEQEKLCISHTQKNAQLHMHVMKKEPTHASMAWPSNPSDQDI